MRTTRTMTAREQGPAHMHCILFLVVTGPSLQDVTSQETSVFTFACVGGRHGQSALWQPARPPGLTAIGFTLQQRGRGRCLLSVATHVVCQQTLHLARPADASTLAQVRSEICSPLRRSL